MNKQFASEVDSQRRFYAKTAHMYNDMHVEEGDEHHFAICLMLGAIDFLGIKSVLDIGSGTGRALTYIKKVRPDIKVKGIEPVRELREVGYRNGLSEEELVDGDALALDFLAGEFDMVCEFAVLHHVRAPSIVVSEMLRVAKNAIFISDSNNFGHGRGRSVKQALNLLGLWRAFDYIKTRGRGYSVSEEDGLAYSYSVFNNYRQIRAQCKNIHILNTMDAGINPYRTAPHVALLGVKQ